MTAQSSEPQGPANPEVPQTVLLARWQRIREWFRPQSSPAPLRFNAKSQDVLSQLGTPSAAVVDELLAEAKAAYEEAGIRAESAERRATTIQGSIAIASSLTLAGGSLLLNAGKVPSHRWYIAISVGFAVTVICLAVAAWRAFLVTWPRFLWASPAVAEIVEHAGEPSAETIRLRRTSDLLVAYGRNDSIARLKLDLLGQAVRWLMSALALLAVLAMMLAAYAIDRSAGHSAKGHCARSSLRDHACREESSPKR